MTQAALIRQFKAELEAMQAKIEAAQVEIQKLRSESAGSVKAGSAMQAEILSRVSWIESHLGAVEQAATDIKALLRPSSPPSAIHPAQARRGG